MADPDVLSPRLRRRRAFALVGLTYAAPGAAQIVAGNKRLGRLGLRVWFLGLALVGVAVVLALVKRNWLLGFATSTWVLWGVAALCVLLAVVWLVAFVDTARLARVRGLPGSTRRGVVALTVLGMILTAVPLGWAASSLYAGGSALRAVFGAGPTRPPDQGRYNILLLGGDSGTGRIGTRPDTIMLASLDAQTGQTVTFGFARDTENINFRPGSTMARLMPQGWNCGDECLLNGLYMWATERKDQFPADVADPGALATKEAVEALSGLDIQYYALVDLQGFQTMIDAVGGIDVINKVRVPVGGGSSPIYYYIEPGRQHLDGTHALWYARSREGATNYERMARQKCVLQAASKQVDPQTVLLRFRELAAAGQDMLHTDIPQGDLGALADLVVKSRSLPMRSVNFTPPLINPWDYDPAVIRAAVAQAVAAPQTDSSTGSSSGSATGSTTGSGGRSTAPRSTGPGSPVPSTSVRSGASGAGGAGGGAADSSKAEASRAAQAGEADICTVP
ncbi:MAG: LCP family protein [Austwickia sp.]|nr:LCP family protein [Austwickia sp.]